MFNININKFLEIKKLGIILKLLFAYIAVCGLVLFPCFIAEEAIQVAIWATWPAKSSKDWNLVLKGCDIINSINLSLKIINYSAGWVQPLAFLSYRSFARGTDYYTESLENQIFANAPETFDGRKIEFMFTPQKIVREGGQVILVNRKIRVIVRKMPDGKSVRVSGVVRVENGLIIIEDEGNDR